jgi:hypothetical protein
MDHAGEPGDGYFMLESRPGVIRETERRGELLVFRHA